MGHSRALEDCSCAEACTLVNRYKRELNYASKDMSRNLVYLFNSWTCIGMEILYQLHRLDLQWVCDVVSISMRQYMYVKDPQLFVTRVGKNVPVARLGLTLSCLL